MTDAKMGLLELVEQEVDADLVREMLAFAAERLKVGSLRGGERRQTGNALIKLVHETGVITMKLSQRSPLVLTKWLRFLFRARARTQGQVECPA